MKRDLGVDAELVIGGSGEFTVWVGDKQVAEKRWGRFPDPADVIAAVRAAQS